MVDGTGTEEEILEEIRSLVCLLPANNEDDNSYDECTDDLNRLCDAIENAAEDTAVVLSTLSDNHVFFETKETMQRNGNRIYPSQRCDDRCSGKPLQGL